MTTREMKNLSARHTEHSHQLADLIRLIAQNAIAANAQEGWLLTLASELSDAVCNEAVILDTQKT